MVHLAWDLRPLETERPQNDGPAAESGGIVVSLLSPTMQDHGVYFSFAYAWHTLNSSLPRS